MDKKQFNRKQWKGIQSDKTWSIFKIMSEFVEGFEKLSNIGPCVSIFGSARTKPENKYYLYVKSAFYNWYCWRFCIG